MLCELKPICPREQSSPALPLTMPFPPYLLWRRFGRRLQGLEVGWGENSPFSSCADRIVFPALNCLRNVQATFVFCYIFARKFPLFTLIPKNLKAEKILWHCLTETKDMRLPQRIHPDSHRANVFCVANCHEKQFSAEHIIWIVCFQYWMGLAPWKDQCTKKKD